MELGCAGSLFAASMQIGMQVLGYLTVLAPERMNHKQREFRRPKEAANRAWKGVFSMHV